MAVELRGDGSALLFVHGFPLDRTVWRHVMATLTGWRRIAPDLRGFGLTPTPGGDYTIADHADDLAALLDALGVERAVVWGLSMGGYAAFELFRAHRARVGGLILCNTRAAADTPEAQRARDETVALLREDGVAALGERMIPALLAPSSLTAMPHVVDHVRAMITAGDPRGLIAALHAMKQRSDATPLLGSIDVPTLVIAGKDDALIPVEQARAMADAIPAALFACVPDAGHLTPLEQPVASTRLVAEFLASLT